MSITVRDTSYSHLAHKLRYGWTLSSPPNDLMLPKTGRFCHREGKKGYTVMKHVTCPPCGTIIEGETDDDLVAEFQQHSRDQHGMNLSRDQILAMSMSLRATAGHRNGR